MSDKNFKIKNGLDAVGPITISPSSNSITSLIINSVSGGTGIIFNRNGSSVASIDDWGTYNGSGINIVQNWTVRSPGIEAQSFFWVGSGARSSAGFSGTNSGTNPVIYISQNGTATNDLTQWIKADNTVLAKVDYLGNLTANDLTLAGNLTVNGTTTNLNSTNLIIEDKNIIIADVATPTNTTADGAGITIKGATDKTFNWVQSTGRFTSSEPIQSSAFISTEVYASQIGSTVIGTATLNTNSDTGGLLINTAGVANKGLIIRGANSQTANLTEWQNSSGTVLSRITSSGQLAVPNVYSVNGSGAFIAMNSTSGAVVINTNAAGNIGTIIRGTASQTADLQQWQDSSGTVLASISPAGKLTSAVDASINGMTIGLGGGNVSSNVAFGQGALASNVSGQNNTAIGYNALNSSTSTFNVAIGGSALAALTTGGTNVALGVLAMRHATTADSAVAIGYSAAGATTTGGYFVAIGAGALGANVTGGTDTVAIGYAALNQATATSLTTAVGSGAGYALTTGTQNTYLGRVADGVTTGSNNMMLGYSATSSSATVSNEITLGNSSITRFRIPGIGLNITSNSTINTASASTVGLIVKGAASQTANLQQWQDSAGNLVAWTGFDGRTYLSYSMIGTWNLDAQQTIYSNSASRIGQVIRGAASQTANLQEWQNSSGTVLTRIGSDGAIYRGAATIDSYGAIYTTETMAIGANAGQRFATGGLTIINRENASAVILGIKGLASQSGDLTQWRNSSDVVIANVAADGAGTFKALTLTSGNGTFTSPGWSGFGTFGPSGGTSGVTLGISPYIATNTALVVKGFASQSANLQEWQDSTGGLLAVINNSGQIATYGRLTVGSSVISTDARMVLLNTGTTTSVLQIIRGIASQTGDLTQWQNSSGTVLASVSSTGKLTITNTSAATSLIEVNGAGGGNFTVSAYGGISTNAGLQSIGSTSYFGGYGGASNLVLNVTGASGQTGDLQRWTNFAGTILAKVDSLGNFTATSKSFDIEHPTKENMRLRYGSLEGPENGVYIRGTVESNVIELPEYWTELVHKDSITASLTPVGSAQNIYVEKIENNKIYIGGDLQKAFFTVYGERKDIDKLTVEY